VWTTADSRGVDSRGVWSGVYSDTALVMMNAVRALDAVKCAAEQFSYKVWSACVIAVTVSVFPAADQCAE